jgi:hypothetical protein
MFQVELVAVVEPAVVVVAAMVISSFGEPSFGSHP